MIVRWLFWLGYGWRGKAFATMCGLLGAIVMLSVIIPYNAYTVGHLQVIPDHACELEDVGILTTREWHDTWYQNVEEVHVATQWREVDTGARYPAFNGPTFPNWRNPTGTVKADIRLRVPNTEGTYQLLLAYDIEGSVLLAPRHQDVPGPPQNWIVSRNTLTVEKCNA